MEESTSIGDGALALIANIPPGFHSKDLRRFFSTFVESCRFVCFHYRHRPETISVDGDGSDTKRESIGRCCLVRVSGTSEDKSEFIRFYNGRNWTNERGGVLPACCRIFTARLADNEPLPMELKPPITTMPRGNVGTPTQYFLDAIKTCRLPASVIAKLGLVFPKRNARRIFSNVPPPSTSRDRATEMDEKEKEVDYDSDDEPAEEWDRHEAQYDDVTDQERTKERLYEEDMEIVWEKGGPGLVYYTDAFYWDQQETDTDAKWADDWDVDTNVYIDPIDADKDARDSVTIRREMMLRSGQLEESVFTKKRSGSPSRRTGKKQQRDIDETYGKPNVSGLGKKMMEKQGWKPGTGLGATSTGKVKPVHDELREISRAGLDKRGLGYFGEKIDRNVSGAYRRDRASRLITTIYDDPKSTDPSEPLSTRHEPTWNKHR